MVALGNNRNNGSNLGAFYLNANNALRRMMAAISRSFKRPNEKNLNSVMSYLGWLMATGRMRLICDKIKEEKIKCRCTLIQKLVPMN